MKRLVVTSSFLLMLILSVTFFPTLSRSEEVAAVGQISVTPATRTQILEATIHIILYPNQNPEPAGAARESQQDGATHEIVVERARGIGTVVTTMGQILIVTHDHWEWEPEELDRVELRDARNNLLLELDGHAFGSIIRYRDGGTTILQAPGILISAGIVPASLSAAKSITPGSIVQVAYRSAEDRGQMAVQSALVESTSDREGRPILNLRSLDGQSPIRGDSGGGVWFQGQLVGNLWKAVTVESTVQETRIWGSKEVVVTTADISIAARFPLDAQTLETVLVDSAPSESGSEY